MASKYLSSLSTEEYTKLTEKLWSIQNHTCFICEEEIDLKLNKTNIDHIIPLVKNSNKDKESNFAVTHESCNKSKQDADLKIARILARLAKIQKNQHDKGESASLKHILEVYDGSQYDFIYTIEKNILSYSFSKMGDNSIYKTTIFEDNLSKELTCFIEVPIQYLFHDEEINPRPINSSIGKMIKEFDRGHPQLHLSLARILDNKLQVFDGQHKAVAQIFLGTKKLVVRLFINPDVARLTETNTIAGSTLRQIAFDKSVMTHLNDMHYSSKLKAYQLEHGLAEDDYSFSEQNLVDYFMADRLKVKKFIIDSIKESVTKDADNRLSKYIDFEGKAKELPISYSAYDKTFLSTFINSKLILTKSIDFKMSEGLNPRSIEKNQFVKLLNIIADTIYVDKFNPEVGVHRIEAKILDGKGLDITDEHLIAFRMSKEEILINWLSIIKDVIKHYFYNTGKGSITEKVIFQHPFDEQLWINIENFVRNLSELPFWKDRNLAGTIFTGKQNRAFWETIFKTGKTSDGVLVLANPLSYIDMIQSDNG